MKLMIPLFLFLILSPSFLQGQSIYADPSNYTSFLSQLEPGDTLILAPGNYMDRLNIRDLNGTAQAPIVIKGNDDATVFIGNACCNTVSIIESSFITIQDFTIDGQNIQYIDAVKAEDHDGNWAHDIILENLLIIGHGANQQTVGISTKCPTWNWVIRGCTIEAAGTGIYLGNSNGEEPFVNGIIEYNLIKNTIGYNLQIKHQNDGSRNISGMVLNGKTIIRHNVFSKELNSSSGGNSRPNLLVGNFPSSGGGSNDHYEIYGNFFWQNPSEALFQGTGNLAFYNNIGINQSGGYGVSIIRHNGFEPRDIKVFHNTIITNSQWGIRFLDTDGNYQKFISANAVFSDHPTPIRIVGSGSSSAVLSENITDAVNNANNYINNLSLQIEELDLYPSLGSALNANVVSSALFQDYSDYSLDFNGIARTWNYRGAYTGEGNNEGWSLAIEKKPLIDPITSTDENNISPVPEMFVSPNPTQNDVLWIHTKNMNSTGQLSVFDINGKPVLTERYLPVHKTKIDLSQQPSGIYFVKLWTSQHSSTRTFIHNSGQ